MLIAANVYMIVEFNVNNRGSTEKWGNIAVVKSAAF